MGITRHGTDTHQGRRLAATLVAAALGLSLGAVPVGASESPEADASAEQAGTVTVTDQRIPMSGSNSNYDNKTMWIWSKGGLGYTLTGAGADSGGGQPTLQQIDLGTGELADSRTLEPPAFLNGVGQTANSQSVAVDEEGGRLFVAYANPGPYTATLGGDSGIGGSPGVVSSAASRGQACTATESAVLSSLCVAGVHILDAETLESQGRIDLRTVSVDGSPLGGYLKAMSYSPARHEGDRDKLYLMIEEWTHQVTGGKQRDTSLRFYGSAIHYLVQMDVAAARTDWVFRLDACRYPREPKADSVTAVGPLPNPNVVFRSQLAGDEAVYVGCHASGQVATIVRVGLEADGAPAPAPMVPGDAVTAAQDIPSAEGSHPTPDSVARPAQGTTVYPGPENANEFVADVASGRILVKVFSGLPPAQVWWVFDTARGQYLGTIGIGKGTDQDPSASGFDAVHGRLYVAHPKGLLVADVRRDPLAQATLYPGITSTTTSPIALWVRGEDEPRLLYVPEPGGIHVWRDASPVGAHTQPLPIVQRTYDLVERGGVTASVFDGAARGYGARLLLVGGAESAARVGPSDPVGVVVYTTDRDDQQAKVRPLTKMYLDHCLSVNRELVLGFLGPEGAAVVDGGGSRGTAEPVVMDSTTRADMEAPATRCAPKEWDDLWSTALFGRAPAGEPSVPWVAPPRAAACTSGTNESDQVSDSLMGQFTAGVACGDGEASGFSYARGASVGGVGVGEALSSFRIYRDPARGIVSRVESVARGVDVAGVLRIASVRGTVESWANGRQQPVAEADREEGYDPNCDRDRTAGTCFQRHLFGVWTPGYACGPCGDESRLIDGLNKALGANGKVAFRQPNPELARGSEDGFIAAVTKPDHERFADLVLNNDLLQTVVPVLEIIRYTTPSRLVSGAGGPRGRQVVQLAGMEASTSYGIQCLLVYDEEAGTCGAPAEEPGSIVVSLQDADGEPLAGGAFEVRADVDGDGVLGLVDTLLPDGACVTAEDGVGTCTFEGLAPGTYLVSQVAAPPGYAKSDEPWVSEVASGEQRTVAFTNVSNVSTIDMTVTDESGAPVSGATFAAYPDPDADGKVAPEAESAATCTTDADGVCTMAVPAGSYVLVQTGAPGGLEGIEPVAFTFASGGQVAAVTVVNYPPSQPAAPEGSASPDVIYTAPVGYSPPVESIDDTYVPAGSVGEPAVAGPSVPEQIGGTVVRVIRAPGDALRLLARDPKQAAAWTAALALFALALLAVRRRQLLGGLTATPAFAYTGNPPPAGPAAGPSTGPSAGPPSGGPAGRGSGGPSGGTSPSARLSSGGAAGSMRAAFSGASAGSATTVLERPPVVGAAPAPSERVGASVVVASASPVLAAMVTGRLASADRVTLLAAVDSLEELRATSSKLDPDVLVVDLTLPTDGPYDVCDLLAGLHAPNRTVGLIPAGASLQALVTRGHRAGLAGLLSAESDLGNGHLGYAVRAVAAGQMCYGPAVQAVLVERWGSLPRDTGKKAARGLTPRELEVARLAAAGLGRSDIAKRLYVSPETVKRQLRIARAKLGVSDPRDAELLRRRLADHDLLDPDLADNHDRPAGDAD